MLQKITIALILLSGMASCTDRVLTDRFQDIDPEGWAYDSAIYDSFEIEDTAYYYQLYANLRISGDYPYSNIHLKFSITAPDNTSKDELAEIILAEKSGKWLGSGLGDVLTYQEAIGGKKTFKQKGKYLVKLEQNMRIRKLPHVHSAGIKVIKLEEIF